MITDVFQIRLIGEDIEPGLVKSRELADILVSIEDMIASIMVREDSSTKKEGIVVGLKEITSGSINLKFCSIKPLVVAAALMVAATAINTGEYDTLPKSAVSSLQTIVTFNKKHKCSAELTMIDPQNTVAVITPETEILFQPPIIGETTIYGRVLRVGGKTPKAMVETLKGKILYCDLDMRLAKQLGQKLYELVSITGVAKWDAHDLMLEDFQIKDVGGYEGRSIVSTVDELSSLIGKYFKDITDVKDYISKIRRGELTE